MKSFFFNYRGGLLTATTTAAMVLGLDFCTHQALAAEAIFTPKSQQTITPAPIETNKEATVAGTKPTPPSVQIQTVGFKPLVQNQPPPTQAPRPNNLAEIKVDELGNKTLVVKGETPPRIMLNEESGQTQVLFGDDTASLIMDSQGRKTLVVRGDDPNYPNAPNDPVTAPDQPTTVGGRDPAPERPYWEVEAQEPTSPYFTVPPPNAAPNQPYWLTEKSEEASPYWLAEKKETAPYADRPYWLPKPEVREIIASEVKLASLPPALQPEGTSSVVPKENAAPGKTISYYMFQDERGVKHLTNTPNDPRYRLFTVVVTMQRGLGGTRVKFTHDSLRPIILRAAAIHNLDPALIAAVIKSESAFDPNAISMAGAQGLMQLMPGTARDMGVTDAFDPEQNVMGGSRYLRLMLNRFNNDPTLAIAAYNCGPERVARVLRVPNIAETQNYVVIVKRNYEKYRYQF